jgi:hypothetical protein
MQFQIENSPTSRRVNDKNFLPSHFLVKFVKFKIKSSQRLWGGERSNKKQKRTKSQMNINISIRNVKF